MCRAGASPTEDPVAARRAATHRSSVTPPPKWCQARIVRYGSDCVKHARRRSCWNLPPGHEAVPGSTAIERSGRVLSLVLLMQRIRKPLSWLVAGWLVFQLATLVAAPIVLGGSGAVHAASDDANCTCPPGTAPGLTCPMHSSPYGDAPACRIRSTSGPSDAALLSLVGGLGVLPPSRSVPYVAPVARAVAIPTVALIGRSELPESPPPRA